MGFPPEEHQVMSNCRGVKSHQVSIAVCSGGINERKVKISKRQPYQITNVSPEKIVDDQPEGVPRLVVVPRLNHNDGTFDDFDMAKHTTTKLEALSLKDGQHSSSRKVSETISNEGCGSDRRPSVSSYASTRSTSTTLDPVTSSSPPTGESSSSQGMQPQQHLIPVAAASAPVSPRSSQRSLQWPQGASIPVTQSQSPRPLIFRSEREKFLVFIKILFKCLDQANEPEVRQKAKRIVSECTRRNRNGDPEFSPLMEAVEKRLRGFVGEAQWRRAHLLLYHYTMKRMRAMNEGGSTQPKQVDSSSA